MVLGASPAHADTIRLGVVTSTEPGFPFTTVEPVVAALEARHPRDLVRVTYYTSTTLTEELLRDKPDFLLSSASDFIQVLDTIGAHPVATRKTNRAAAPSSSIGAALVVRSDRHDLQRLADLRGKTAAATQPLSTDGWPAVRLTLREAGFQDSAFFQKIAFLTYAVPDVLSAVLTGAVDVAMLPACALERAQEEGLLEPGLLRVIGTPPDEALACWRSTALYPDYVAGALPWTDPRLAKDFTVALLEIKTPSHYEWQVTSDFRSLSNLHRELHLGRWAILDDTSFAGLWRRYGRYALIAGALLLFLLFNEWRLRRLVRSRTAALHATMREKERLAQKEEAARERLSELERMGAINQLCAMIAHELKQPVGAVINYMAVVRMKWGEVLSDDPVTERAVSGAEREVKRIADIVDRVRGYAKRQRRTPEPVDLRTALVSALSHVKHAPETKVVLDAAENVFVTGDPLELELLALNLVKNAVQALDAEGGGTVTVTLRQTDVFTATLRIADNGPKLSDETFAKLMKVSDSVKEGGLGLGLAIVRNIVDEHGATLSIERLDPQGIAVTVNFDTLNPNDPNNDLTEPASGDPQ